VGVTITTSSWRRWLTGLCLLVLASAPGTGAQGPAVPSLLGAASPGARVPLPVVQRLDTLQARPVSVNAAALSAPAIDIELTSGRVVRAELDRRERHPGGAEAWSGHVVGEPLSSVTLVMHDGVLQGAVRLLDAAYSIEPASGGPVHLVRLVDASATGVDLEPLLPQSETAPVEADAPPVAGDDGSTVDVAVFYTASARTVAGGDAAVQTRIALGISETNTAYANSGITPRLRLVAAELTNYTESGNLSTDLGLFRGTADGVMDTVHTRRDAVGADMMVLIVGDTAGGACGVGYVMTSLSAGFAGNAFSVTAYPCISPNYTFAHELGHNMGSAHAPEDGSGQNSLYPYSFGYKNPSNLFRTVMAYNCTAGCPRVLHFSNPNASYSGAVTGTAVQHDNTRSINSAAATIANWRQAVGSAAAPTLAPLSNVTINEDAVTPSIAVTVGDTDTDVNALVVTATSSNPTLVPNTGAALTLGGSGANRTLVVTPAANRNGTSTISVTVSDGGQTATRTFTLTVNAVNDAPTVTRSPGAGTIASGLTAHTTVTITDIDTAGSALLLSTSSSNTTVLPNAGVAVSVTSTTATTRTFDVAMTPAAGQAGLATVTLSASDGVATATTTYALTVTIPQPPAIAPIAAQVTSEDTPGDVAFSLSDGDTPLDALAVTATSSNTALLPHASLVITGNGANRTLTATPAANQSGAATITVVVNDGISSAQTSFVLTVTAVDDPPAFAPGVPLAISTVVGTPTTFQVTVTDPDTAGSLLSLTTTTTAAALIANSGLTTTPLSSTASSRTFAVTVLPNPGMTGAGGIALLGEDLTSAVGRTVQVSVTATPAAPDAPTGLSIVVAGSTLALSWTPATTGSAPTSFEVHIGNAPGATTLPVQTTAGTSLNVPITVGGTYFARVKAVNVYGTSVSSPEVSVNVVPPNPRPGPPAGLTASFSGRTISIVWTAPTTGDPVTNYLLEVGSAPGLSNLLVVPMGPGLSFVAPGVPDGMYWLRVRGSNAAGLGVPSSDLGVVMSSAGGCVGLPYAPVMQAPSVSGSLLSLSWNAPAGTVAPSSYVLFAGSGPGRADLAVLDLGSTATTFAANAPPGTYFLRVAGRSACGVGATSNDTTAAVFSGGGGGGGGVVPVPPTAVNASVNGRVISLSWTPPATGATPTSYVVDVGTTAGSSNLGSFNTGSTATAVSGTVAPGRYFIRLRTRANTLLSAPSSDVVVVVP
jgi:Metallo-peptidase family M12B Reprolysin-like/Bacterial Ig domain